MLSLSLPFRKSEPKVFEVFVKADRLAEKQAKHDQETMVNTGNDGICIDGMCHKVSDI